MGNRKEKVHIDGLCSDRISESALGLSTPSYFICFDLCVDVRNPPHADNVIRYFEETSANADIFLHYSKCLESYRLSWNINMMTFASDSKGNLIIDTAV